MTQLLKAAALVFGVSIALVAAFVIEQWAIERLELARMLLDRGLMPNWRESNNFRRVRLVIDHAEKATRLRR